MSNYSFGGINLRHQGCKMNTTRIIFSLALAFANDTWSEPVKCLIDGRSVYTDDASRCSKASVKPIKNNVSVFPKVTPNSKSAVLTPPQEPASSSTADSILGKFGVSPQDVENGWKTVMDAKKRGSWKAPDMPDEAK
jgi:hypothetical protein